jgi:hypothetical protein
MLSTDLLMVPLSLVNPDFHTHILERFVDTNLIL